MKAARAPPLSVVRAPLYRGGLAYGAPQGGAEQASPPPRGRDFDGRTALQGRGAPYEPGAPRPQAHLNGAEYLFTSSSDQRERSRAVASALKWGAGWGKAGPLGGGALFLQMLLSKKEGAFWCSLWKPDRKSLVKTKQAAYGGS